MNAGLLVSMGAFLVSFYSLYYTFVRVKSKKKRTKKDYTTDVSIVVPVYNEEAIIQRKLENVKVQEYGPTEIIVIDSGSTDKTLELVKDAAENNPHIKILQQKKREGKASALNMAFSVCSGTIVVITDADAVWAPTTLKEAISNFSTPSVGAVTGRQVLLNPDQTHTTKIEKSYRHFYEILRIGESTIDSTPIFHGEISCYRKCLIEPLREDTVADDSALALQVRKKGFRTIYDPACVFYEYAPPTVTSRYNQKVRRAQGLIQLFVREWKILFNRKFGYFGMIIFPAEFFMHVFSPFFVVGFLAVLLWSLFTNVYVGYGCLAVICGFFISFIINRDFFNSAASFFQSQSILLISLLYLLVGKTQYVWPQVEEVRDLWQREEQRKH